MNKISMKQRWVATSGWRGYMTFDNSVAGANDTGTFDDSPCPSPVRAREIGMAKAALRKAGIRHRTAWARTSNCFSVGQHVLVAPQDRQRALEALRPLVDETRLLWVDRE